MPLLFPVIYLFVEFVTFFAVGLWIGFGWALLSLVMCFALGMLFAWFEMRSIARRAATSQASPVSIMGDYGLLFAGLCGVSLPGFISSIAGLLLIIPPTRAIVRRALGRNIRARLERLGARTFTMTQSSTLAESGWDDDEFSRWSQTVTPEDFIDAYGNEGNAKDDDKGNDKLDKHDPRVDNLEAKRDDGNGNGAKPFGPQER